MRAAIDPVWGRFLVRLGVDNEAVFEILGERLVRSITRGADVNRFLVSDVATVSEMTIGALLAAAKGFLIAERPASDAASLFAEHHFARSESPRKRRPESQSGIFRNCPSSPTKAPCR